MTGPQAQEGTGRIPRNLDATGDSRGRAVRSVRATRAGQVVADATFPFLAGRSTLAEAIERARQDNRLS